MGGKECIINSLVVHTDSAQTVIKVGLKYRKVLERYGLGRPGIP